MFLRYSVEKELTRKINVKVKESDEFQYAAKTYELCGFTVHTGASGNSGHYRAYRVSGVVYDDHGGASEPTLRKISSEGLEKQKENGYIYLYKKISRPSEEVSDMSAPSSSSVAPSLLPLSTSAEEMEGPASCFKASSPLPLSTHDDGENNSVISRLNDGLKLPVVKTPSKRVLKENLQSTPEPSTPSSSSGSSLKWHPSPAKRWKYATEMATKPPSPVKTLDNQIQELREFIQPTQLKVPENILHQGCFGEECWYVGEKGKTSWDRDPETLYVMIESANKVILIRNQSQATGAELMEMLIDKFSADLPFVSPCLSYRGEPVTDKALTR